MDVKFAVVHHRMHLMFVGLQYGQQQYQSFEWAKLFITIGQQPTAVHPGLQFTLVLLPQLLYIQKSCSEAFLVPNMWTTSMLQP